MITRTEQEIRQLRLQLAKAPVPTGPPPALMEAASSDRAARGQWKPPGGLTYREELEDWWENGVGKQVPATARLTHAESDRFMREWDGWIEAHRG